MTSVVFTRTTSPSSTSSGPGAETASEGALAGEAAGAVPGVVNVGGRGAGAGSLPIRVGGSSCDCSAPTRRGREAVAEATGGVAESPLDCDRVVRGSEDVLPVGADLRNGLEGPAVDAMDLADVLDVSPNSPVVCRSLPFTANDLS